MSVPNSVPVVSRATNGITTAFSFPFKILKADDLLMTFTGGTLPSYTVTGLGSDSGGSVTFSSAPATGVLVLYRQVSYDRSTDYQYQGQLQSAVVNQDFDRIVLMIQQLDRDQLRSIKMPLSDVSGQVLDLDAATRASKALIFDASGNITVSDDNYNDQVADVAASAAAAAASAADSASSATNSASSATQAAAQLALVTTTASAITPSVTLHSGTGAQVAFTLPSSPPSQDLVDVYISGVRQDKTKWSVAGNTLNFNTAPASGTNNIEVKIAGTVAAVVGANEDYGLITESAASTDDYGAII